MRNYIGNNNEINKKKYKKSLPPKLNPDAGNVEHNIDMFNKVSSGDANLSSAAGMNGMAESYDRDSLIARITEFGKHYNFDKYTDAQLNAMLNRLVDAENYRKRVLLKHQDKINIQSDRHIMNDDPSYNFDDPEREGEYRVENLREALNRLDHYCIDNDKVFYDLRSLYENIQHQLTPQEKQELKKLVDTTNDPDAIKAYIDSKDPQKKNEELDEGVLDTLKAKRQARLDKIDAKKRAEDPLYDAMRRYSLGEPSKKDDPKLHPELDPRNFIYDRKFQSQKDRFGNPRKVPDNVISVVIKSNVEAISTDAFKDHKNLKEVRFEGKTIMIYPRAFMNCTSLTYIELPESLHTIQSEAFKNCTSLRWIKFQANQLSLDNNAFEGCKSLNLKAILQKYSYEVDQERTKLFNSYKLNTIIYRKKKKSVDESMKDMDSLLLLQSLLNQYPDISIEDEDYLNSLSYSDLVKEIKNRGWEEVLNEDNRLSHTSTKYRGYRISLDHKNLCYNIYDKHGEMEDSGFRSVEDAKKAIDNFSDLMMSANWLDETDVDFDESLNEDTVKQGNKWVNKGKEGTHGKFKTKKAADAQRKAMFANGYKGESLQEGSDEYYTRLISNDLGPAVQDFMNSSDVTTVQIADAVKEFFHEYNKIPHGNSQYSLDNRYDCDKDMFYQKYKAFVDKCKKVSNELRPTGYGKTDYFDLKAKELLKKVDYNFPYGWKVYKGKSDYQNLVALDNQDVEYTDIDFNESLKLKEAQKKTAEQFAEKAINKIKKILAKKYSINPKSEFSYSIEGIGDISDWVQDAIPASGLIAKIKFDQKINLYDMNYDIFLDFDCDKIYKLLENNGVDVIDVSPDHDDIIVIEIAVPLEYQNRGVSLADWNDETDVDFDESLKLKKKRR